MQNFIVIGVDTGDSPLDFRAEENFVSVIVQNFRIQFLEVIH